MKTNLLSSSYQKAMRIVLVIFVLQAILLSTHRGEFWPFSIFPMFSKAGKPWTKALVREVTDEPESTLWKTFSSKTPPENIVAMERVGIHQNDISGLVQNIEEWSSDDLKTIQAMFAPQLNNQKWMIYKVQGKLSESSEAAVEVSYLPLIFLSSGKISLNPNH